MAKLSACSLSKLLLVSDSQFVDAAFLNFLGRMPDVKERHYFIHCMKTGITKSGIISQICRSPKEKISPVTLPRLKKFIVNERKSQWSSTGRISRSVNGEIGNGLTPHRLRTIEKQIHDLGETHSVRFDQIEAALELMHRRLMQSTTRRPIVEKPVSEIPDPKELKHCSPKAKSIYAQIKLAASSTRAGAM